MRSIAWAIVFGLALGPARAAVAVVQCADLPVEIHGNTDATTDAVCAASGAALAFLQRHGLRAKRTIRVDVVDEPLDGPGHPIYGSYDAGTDRVAVMSLRAVRDGVDAAMLYGEPFDEVHYAGAIAHEVAHAVVQHNGLVEPVSRAAQEYIAHATQLAVLPRVRREGIIRAADVGPWETDDVISDLYLAMAPHRFAVKSFLHLTGHADPTAFLRVLLSTKWRYVYVR